jgi:RHS repeat-associated protein
VRSVPFFYVGEQTDSSGLIYLRARFYNPSTGRFLNMDPSRQEMNPYQYAVSNPVMYTDPSGLWEYTVYPTDKLLK